MPTQDLKKMTFVLELKKGAAESDYIRRLMAAFREEAEVAPGVRVTAVSMHDEITKVEQLEARADGLSGWTSIEA